MNNKKIISSVFKKYSWLIYTLVVVAPLILFGNILVLIQDSSFSLSTLFEAINRNFSIDTNTFLLFWFHIPATIVFALGDHKFAKYTKFYCGLLMILFIVWQISGPAKSVELKNKTFAFVSENELNLKNLRHLDCQGIKGQFLSNLGKNDIPASQMSAPKIEIYFDSSWIYERTKYIDKKDNEFQRFTKSPQTKEGEISGWNLIPLGEILKTYNTIEIYFNQSGRIVVRKDSTTSGDGILTMSIDDYSCIEY